MRYLSLLVAIMIVCSDLAFAEEAQVVSFSSLIKDAGSFNMRNVVVIGYLHRYAGDGSCMIFENSNAMNKNDFSKAIWLYLNNDIKDSLLVPDRWVKVQGRFSSINKGQWQLFAGSLDGLKKIESNPIAPPK